MDVKEVRNSSLVQGSIVPQPHTKSTAKSSDQERKALADTLASAPKSLSHAEIRTKVNQAINSVNVASDSVDHIDKVVDSLKGIVEQAQDPQITDSRRQILEHEANQLVDEIKKFATQSSSDGLQPLAGDPIRLEIEERIGKTLDVILPDDAQNGFGLGSVSFSKKDAIINILTNVEEAKKNIADLREQIQKISKSVEAVASTADVALQNSESSKSSVRDLDGALKLASDARVTIKGDPDTALSSVGELENQSLVNESA